MSSRDDLLELIRSLYDIVEVNSAGAVTSEVAEKTIRLVNPALLIEHAATIVNESDSRGRQLLMKDDFVRSVHMCLQNTELSDSIKVVRELVSGLRVVYRRRYLMYDAPMNVPPPALLENRKVVALFRDVFDTVAHGSEFISRSQLRRLAADILPDFKADASNIVKVALGDVDRDTIGFYEFMMTVQPATSRRCLSDMLLLAQKSAESSSDVAFANIITSTVPQQLNGQQQAQSALIHEVNQLRAVNAAAARSFNEVITRAPSYPTLWETNLKSTAAVSSSPPKLPTSTAINNSINNELSTGSPRPLSDGSEVSKLRLENDLLKKEITKLKFQLATPEGMHRSRSVKTLHSTDSTVDASPRVVELENELRLVRAQAAIVNETNDLVTILRRGGHHLQAVLKEYYPDESLLISRHNHLKECVSLFDVNSAAHTLFAQYELVVSAYQALYRALKTKVGNRNNYKLRQETNRESLQSIHALSRSPVMTRAISPSMSSVRARSPSVSVMKQWANLDRPVSEDMRHTRTLADPLLTDEERNTLRSKLATQMRRDARHYSPHLKKKGWGGGAAERELFEQPTMGSMGAMQRLQTITGKAFKEGMSSYPL